MTFTIDSEQIRDTCVLRPRGRMTLGDATETFRRELDRQISDGRTRIVVDLGQVSKIDSSGLGELVYAHTHVARQGGEMRLASLDARARDLMQLVKLSTVFEMFPSVAAAVSAP